MSNRQSTAARPPDNLSLEQRLAVYGSLRPGEANEHILAALTGCWSDGSVRGTLHTVGWGYALGHRAIRLHDTAPEVAVRLFSSVELPSFWPELDAFEGSDYCRVVTDVRVGDTNFPSFIYEFREEI